MKYLIYTLSLFLTTGLFAQKTPDTTVVNMGATKIVIIESEGKDSTKIKPKKVFNAWTGIDMGFNSLRTSGGSFTMPDEYNYMELDYAKSLSWNFNFADVNWDWLNSEEKFGYNKRNIGIISGLGLTFENYNLKNNYTLTNLNDSTFGVFDSIRDYTKNKLRAYYLRLPVMLQFYSMRKTNGKVRHNFHFAAGVVGGLRLGSSYKVKYKIDGDETKDKKKDDYNMSSISLDAEVRIGYRSLNLFASYGLTSLFENNRGPELYPMTLGVSLTHGF